MKPMNRRKFVLLIWLMKIEHIPVNAAIAKANSMMHDMEINILGKWLIQEHLNLIIC